MSPKWVKYGESKRPCSDRKNTDRFVYVKCFQGKCANKWIKIRGSYCGGLWSLHQSQVRDKFLIKYTNFLQIYSRITDSSITGGMSCIWVKYRESKILLPDGKNGFVRRRYKVSKENVQIIKPKFEEVVVVGFNKAFIIFKPATNFWLKASTFNKLVLDSQTRVITWILSAWFVKNINRLELTD